MTTGSGTSPVWHSRPRLCGLRSRPAIPAERPVAARDGIPRNDDDANEDEDDLVTVTMSVTPANLPGQVTLTKADPGNRVKLWTSATKGEGNEQTLPPDPAWTPATVPAEPLYLEGCANSAELRDVTLQLKYTGHGLNVTDRAKVTVVGLTVEEVGFSNDHIISRWPSGSRIDDPDGTVPVWKRTGNPDDPVCYTKDTTVTMFARFALFPSFTTPRSGTAIRARSGLELVGRKDGLVLTGDELIASGIAGGEALEASVGTTVDSFDWELSLDGGATWAARSVSGLHKMHWTDATPAASPLYDLGWTRLAAMSTGPPRSQNGSTPGSLRRSTTIRARPSATMISHFSLRGKGSAVVMQRSSRFWLHTCQPLLLFAKTAGGDALPSRNAASGTGRGGGHHSSAIGLPAMALRVNRTSTTMPRCHTTGRSTIPRTA
mgnify:CR=1 FL=1